MIQHISFDVWNTLIKANPAFAAARTEFFATRYGVDFEQMKHEYTTLKHHADDVAEKNGKALSTFALTRILIGSVMVGEPNEAEVQAAMDVVNELFREHPPIIEDSTIQLMNELTDRGITVSIGSNSNFISGYTMHPWLNSRFDKAFQFGIYSDAIGVAKPFASFFGRVIDGVYRLYGYENVLVRNIMHVGDSELCDVFGPSQLGMQALLISDPKNLYNDVIKSITEQ